MKLKYLRIYLTSTKSQVKFSKVYLQFIFGFKVKTFFYS